MADDWEFCEYGDAGLLVTFTGGDAESRWERGRRIATALRADAPPGLVDVAASYASVLAGFDPLRTTAADIQAAVVAADQAQLAPPTPARLRLPVVFGGEHGPDLTEVAQHLDVGESEVIDLVCATPWTVRFIGSPAGAPMLDGHDRFSASIPRRRDPRTHLPAGSVGLSGQQCVIYLVVSPGGWQLVGRTPAQLFDLDRDPITDVRPGDLMDLVAVDARDWDAERQPLRRAQRGSVR